MLLALISAIVVANSCARDSSSKEPATLAQAVHITAFHLDAGGGNVTVNREMAGMSDSRMVVGLCDFSSYLFAWGVAVSSQPSPTSYVVPGTDGFRPDLYVGSIGWEVRRRWRDSAIFHPLVSLGGGTIRATYHYTLITPTRVFDDSNEREATTTYYAPAAGVEASIFKYVSLYVLAGVRYAGEMNLPGLSPHAFSGPFITTGLGFGKFH